MKNSLSLVLLFSSFACLAEAYKDTTFYSSEWSLKEGLSTKRAVEVIKKNCEAIYSKSFCKNNLDISVIEKFQDRLVDDFDRKQIAHSVFLKGSLKNKPEIKNILTAREVERNIDCNSLRADYNSSPEGRVYYARGKVKLNYKFSALQNPELVPERGQFPYVGHNLLLKSNLGVLPGSDWSIKIEEERSISLFLQEEFGGYLTDKILEHKKDRLCELFKTSERIEIYGSESNQIESYLKKDIFTPVLSFYKQHPKSGSNKVVSKILNNLDRFNCDVCKESKEIRNLMFHGKEL